MEREELEKQNATEREGIERALCAVKIAESKARIYARLLTEISLAKAMETLAERYETQKTALQALLGEKQKKGKAEEGGK